jgi:hypothetical protein
VGALAYVVSRLAPVDTSRFSGTVARLSPLPVNAPARPRIDARSYSVNGRVVTYEPRLAPCVRVHRGIEGRRENRLRLIVGR